MPCSDGGAYDYLDDHRTQRQLNENEALRKEVLRLEKRLEESKTEKELKLEAELQTAKIAAKDFAQRLNKTTELLCNATFVLFEEGYLHENPKLQEWFNNHTEEDASRMKTDLDKIMKRKNGTIQSLFKWYETLDAKEQWVFETHKNFKGIKLN
jgi:hypothetical protein